MEKGKVFPLITSYGSFPGVEWPGRSVDHPPSYSAEVKERVEKYLYSTFGPSWLVIGWTLLYLYLYLTRYLHYEKKELGI